MSEKITYGIRNGHYAQVTHDADGNPIFGVVKRWEGWTEMSLPPVGDPVKIYADDVVYFKKAVNDGYEGNVNAHQVPDDFKINHLGEYVDPNGVFVEKSVSDAKEFALLGEFQTDGAESGKKRFALYNCSAGRADFASSTKTQSIEPNSFSVPITASPTIADEIVKATIRKADNEAIFNSWFDSVYYNPAMVARFKIGVTVTDGSVPVSNAVVVLDDKIAKTNSSGVATFMLPAGVYDLFTSKTGFDPATQSVTVSAAMNLTVTLIEA